MQIKAVLIMCQPSSAYYTLMDFPSVEQSELDGKEAPTGIKIV